MQTRYRWLFPILLSFVLLGGCARAMRPADGFRSAHTDFSQRLRWKDCGGAGRYLTEPYRSDFLESCRSDGDLQFVLVEVQSVILAEDHRSAETVTLVQYYRLPSTVIKSYHLEQQWVYRQGGGGKFGNWEIDSPFPELP